MSKSNRAKGPDFRVIRPDLETQRRACRAPVNLDSLHDPEDVETENPGVSESLEHDTETFVWVDPELR